eukprot:11164460-Lingulodinium_polyedra.AAC.1
MTLLVARLRLGNLAGLRTVARGVVAHGATRCASEVVRGLFSPTRRLDPGALACIGPVAQAARFE